MSPVASTLPTEPIAHLRAYDPQADAGHALRVAHLSLDLARVFREAIDLNDLYLAACLHDLGKVELHHLARLPRPFTPEERAQMQAHAHRGAEMVATLAGISDRVKHWILHHHERYDGLGYPYGVAGEAIPLGARIIAIADVYDALTNDRPYRPGWSRDEARAYVSGQAGTHFDPRLVLAFEALTP